MQLYCNYYEEFMRYRQVKLIKIVDGTHVIKTNLTNTLLKLTLTLNFTQYYHVRKICETAQF